MKQFLLLTIVLLLSACSGEPSSSDIEKAVKANVDKAAQQMKSQLRANVSNKDLPTLYGVKKLGCSPAQGASGYNCDVELDFSQMFVPRNKNVSKIRFVKGDDGWVVTQ